MKSVTIDVPPEGTRITIEPRGTATQVVVVLSGDAELRVSPVESVAVPSRTASREHSSKTTGSSKKNDSNYVIKRLRKLKTSTREAAENSIRAMFQFEAPMSEKEAGQIFNRLVKEGVIVVRENGKVEFPGAA